MAKQTYGEESVSSWKGLRDLYYSKPEWQGWAFRGQCDANWALQSTLEREMARFGIVQGKRVDWEHWLTREFRRHRSRTGERTPTNVDDRIEWLALMQHHGAPTRLLDFSYSFWIAVFFAIESAAPQRPDYDLDHQHSCALWAFDVSAIEKKALSKLDSGTRSRVTKDRRDPIAIRKIFGQERMVWLVSPFILNERLSVQQGVFLAGTDLTAEFMENLAALDKPSGVLRTHCIKITIAFDLDELQCALTELHVMNISRTALFPGIDGFAASLKNRLAMPHHFSELPKRGLWSSRGLAG